MNILLSIIVGVAVIVGSLFMPTNYGGDDDSLGATSFPSSLDTLTNPASTDKTNSPSHSTQHTNANDALEALEAKIGVNGSAVTTSHDYKLSGVATGDKAVSLTGSETLTNKILTSPNVTGMTATTSTLIGTTLNATTTLNGTTTINGVARLNLGSDATGDVYYRSSAGTTTRLGIGSEDDYLRVNSGVPMWESVSAIVPTGFVNATSTASTTIAFSVDGTDFVQVYAYGTIVETTGGVDATVSLTLGGSNLDTYVILGDSNSLDYSFTTMWFGTPSATTTTLSLTSTNVSSFRDATILYYKY